MAKRRFTKYPSNYIKANIIADKGYIGWKSPDTLEDGTTVWYKDVPGVDCRFYIKEEFSRSGVESPLKRNYVIKYWFYNNDDKPIAMCDAYDLDEAIAIAESEIEQYSAIYGK